MSVRKIVLKNPNTKVKTPLERNYSERFEFLLRLIRIKKMLESAIVVPSQNNS